MGGADETAAHVQRHCQRAKCQADFVDGGGLVRRNDAHLVDEMDGVWRRTHFEQKDEAQQSHHQRQETQKAERSQHLAHSNDAGGNLTRRSCQLRNGRRQRTSAPDVHSTVGRNAFIHPSTASGIGNDQIYVVFLPPCIIIIAAESKWGRKKKHSHLFDRKVWLPLGSERSVMNMEEDSGPWLKLKGRDSSREWSKLVNVVFVWLAPVPGLTLVVGLSECFELLSIETCNCCCCCCCLCEPTAE